MKLSDNLKKKQRKDVASSDPEIWKDIKGFEGFYKISSWGRFISCMGKAKGRIRKNTNKNGWYFTVNLKCANGQYHTKRIHRLVAEHFIPNPLNLPEVNHKDLNKQNNHVNNLEWVDRKMNQNHAFKNKPSMIHGMINYNKYVRPKRIEQFTLDGKLVRVHLNGSDAAKFSGVCQRNILQVANKDEYRPGLTRKQAGGFIWEFKDEYETTGIGK